MPFLIKSAGVPTRLDRGDVKLKNAGTIKDASQLYIKNAGVWKPMFLGAARWGYATYAGAGLNENGHTGPQAFIDALSTVMPSNRSGETLTYFQVDDTTYTYFAFPAEMGTALFTNLANNFAGGWDGATFLQDSSNWDATGPTTVTYDDGTGPALWHVYRTDWPGPDYFSSTFRVDYPNNPLEQ